MLTISSRQLYQQEEEKMEEKIQEDDEQSSSMSSHREPGDYGVNGGGSGTIPEHIRELKSQLEHIEEVIESVSRNLVTAIPMYNNGDGGGGCGDGDDHDDDDGHGHGCDSDGASVESGTRSSTGMADRPSVLTAVTACLAVTAALVVAVVVAVVAPIERGRGAQGAQVEVDNNTTQIGAGDSNEDYHSCFQTTQELYEAVDYVLLQHPRSKLCNSSLALRYGWPIGAWCVGKISDFSFLFSESRNSLSGTFNDDISAWDTSNATTMQKVFHGAKSFDGYLGNWNVSKVVNMESAFHGAKAFTGNGGREDNHYKVGLSNWDVSNVVSLSETFSNAPNFVSGNISSWNVSNVRLFRKLFSSASVSYFNDDVSQWDVSNGIDFSFAFKNQVNFNADLSSWNVSKAINMDSMFKGASSFVGGPDKELSNWDVSQVTSMRKMFNEAKSFVGTNISKWNVSNVESFDRMFMGCKSFDDDLSTWDVSSAIEMKWMFFEASSFRQNLCDWGEKLVSSSLPSSRSLSWKALEGKRRRQSEDAETNDNSFVRGMFFQTFCPMGYAPNLTDPPGPFCFECTL